MILLKEESVTLACNATWGFLFQKWSGFCPDALFHQAIDITFRQLRQRNFRKILSDVRSQRVVSPRCQDYVQASVMEFVRERGNIWVAFVVRDKSPVNPCLNRYLGHMHEGNERAYNAPFPSMQKALQWLQVCEGR